MRETTAAQPVFMLESLRPVTGKVTVNNVLRCLITAEGQIEMIEQISEMPNDVRDFRNIVKLNDPDVKTHQVYFLYCAGFVKIGVATHAVRRAADLQIGSPWQNQIVLLIRGGRATELFLHFAFGEHRVGGEWFRLAPPIREAIKLMAPADCQQWLAEEEHEYKEWVREEAVRLGLITEPT